MCIYYTDGHDVDENEMTIPNYGGNLFHGNLVGFAHRAVNYAPIDFHDTVASYV